MRLVVGIALVVRRIIELQSAPPIRLAVIHVLAIAAGIVLLAGLWTPIAGVLLAIIEIWSAFTHPHDPWSYILLGTLGAALAMLGTDSKQDRRGIVSAKSLKLFLLIFSDRILDSRVDRAMPSLVALVA
jgi:hypothetical protein